MSNEKPDEAVRDLAAQVGLTVQPDPIPNESPSMHDLVAADLQTRKEFGLRKYGTILQAGNGRNPLLDAYDEVLDHAVYIKQALIERDEMLELIGFALRLRKGYHQEEEWSYFDRKSEEILNRSQLSTEPDNMSVAQRIQQKYSEIGQQEHDDDVWDFGPQ